MPNNNEQIVVKPSKWKSFKDTYFLTGSIDIPFLGLTIALLTIGLIMLFSASYPYAYYYKDSSYYYFIRQILFAVAGLVAMLLMSKINYKILKAIYKPVFVVTIALLVIVLFHHTNVQNFKRWIPLGPVTIQPSDLAKFTIILTLAVYISKYYKKTVAVSGTHGKTTTTSMVSHILLAGDCDPTISVGGILPAIGGNIRVGNSETFVTEACEYTNSFLSFFPKISIILNMDADHLDFFKDIDDIRHSFRRFAELLPADGTLIINADTPKYEDIIRDLPCNVITYGLEHDADYQAADITYDKYGHASFSVLRNGVKVGSYYLKVPGIHNVSNALAAIALGHLLGLSEEVIIKGLGSFTGTDRRFQYKGEVAGVTIVDDYAHHPTEIEATLHAAHNYPHKKLWCVFQPHTYTRTKALLPEFAKALSLADHVVVADIYAARETDTLGISSEDLQKRIQELGTPCEYFPTFDEIENYLLSNCQEGDLLITMGAGDVVNIGEHLLGK